MAHSAQAKKRIRQSERHTAINRPIRTMASRRVRDAKDAIADGALNAAESVRAAQSALGRAAKKGVIHPNAAARRTSRLAKRLKVAALASA